MIFDLKKTIISFVDGAANELVVKVGEGALVYTERRNIEYVRDRGLLDTVREGDQEPIDVRMDFQWISLYSNGTYTPTPEEVLKQEGAAESWETTSDDDCEPYCIDIKIVHDPDCSDFDPETITLKFYRWETLEHDTDAGMISTTGNCNIPRAEITSAGT